jgi:hypothetical protein
MLQVLRGALYKRVLSPIDQGQERNCRVISMRRNGSSVDDAVSGVPSSSRAGTIEKHLDAATNPRRDLLQVAARARDLVQRENRECGWNNPTDGVRKPWPAKLVGVETDVAIGGAKLPLPKPI